MSVAVELAALRSLARRLSEPWPAERAFARWEAERDNTLDDRARMRSPHVEAEGFWQHRRSRPGRERGPKWYSSRTGPGRGWFQGAARSTPDHAKPPLRRRTWMPSITGVGPVVLRWPAETRAPAWTTYEAVRAILRIESDGSWSLASSEWPFLGNPSLASEAIGLVIGACTAVGAEAPRGSRGADDFARAVAERLAAAVPPERIPAATKHLGSLPRSRARAMQRHHLVRTMERRHFSNRFTLGALAARYTGRRPDGAYTRHDARRWMRAFAREIAVAADALEAGARGAAIGVLLGVVGMDDAIELTRRPETYSSAAGVLVVDDPYDVRPADPEQARRWYERAIG